MLISTGLSLAQEDIDFSSLKIEGEFKVKQIIPGDLFYYINIVNDKGYKIIIMQEKPRKRIIKKNEQDNKTNKLAIGKSYFFKLESRTFNLGFSETGTIIAEDGIEIWNRKTSDFNVCYAENLAGLFYVK